MKANYDPHNIFAKILRGELPCYRLYEDENFLVILDIAPVNPGHALVIPKVEAVLVGELDAQTAGQLLQVGQRVGEAVRKVSPRCEGVNFWIADGASAGQEVPHVHLHVIPRFSGDGFGWKSGPQNRQPQDAARQTALADALRKAL